MERPLLDPGRIGEMHVREGHRAQGRVRQSLWIAGRLHGGLGGQDLAQALRRAGGLGQFAVNLRELAQGACGEDRIEHELRQAPTGHVTGQHVLRAIPEHAHDARRDQEDAGAGEEGPHGGGEPCCAEGLLGGSAEAGGGGAFHAESLHGAHSPDGLRRIGRGIGQAILRRPGAPPHRTA